MLRPHHAYGVLIAALLAATALAQPKTLPSRVTFQDPKLRHMSEAPVPSYIRLPNEPRAAWLARLAAEGRRPVRLQWLPAEVTADRTPDPFASLTLDLKGTPVSLPLQVATPETWTRVMESLAASSNCPCTEWQTTPGRTPDGRVLLGSLLRVGKSGSNLVLSWGASCSDQATDYTVHRGTIGTWYSHAAIDCTTGGATSTTITSGAASSYFLVVPITDDAEGSYGDDSAGNERPKSTTTCRELQVTQRCP